MRMCVLCLNQTYETCFDCGEPFCCTDHESNLCPMCMRIKVFKAEQAERRRVVWWQYVDVPASPVRSVGAETIPMPTMKVRVA